MNNKRLLSLLVAAVLLILPLLGITAGAASVSTRPSIVGVHVRVEASFTAYFYIEAPSPQTTEVGIFVGDVRILATKLADGRYVAVMRGLSPIGMADLIGITPYAVIGTSSNVRGAEYLFGLQDYAMRLLAQEELAEPARNMLIAMLNYGAACQVKENYRTHLLANVGLTEEEKQIPVRSYKNEFVAPSFSGKDLIFSASASAYYKDRLLLSFGFRVDDWENSTDCYMEVADNADFLKSSQYPLVQGTAQNENGGTINMYSADTDGIYLNSLSRPYYIRIVSPNGASKTIAYSVESYAYFVLETEAGDEIDEASKNYLAALIAFGDALRAYDAAAAAPAE